MATDTPPVASMTFGLSKGLYRVQQRSNVAAADFPAGPINLGTVAAQSIDIGLCPTLDFYGSADTCGSMITFAFALYDESSNIIGLSDPISLTATEYTDGTNRFVGATPGTLNVGSARRVALVVLAVTVGTWQLCWRPYGAYHTC